MRTGLVSMGLLAATMSVGLIACGRAEGPNGSDEPTGQMAQSPADVSRIETLGDLFDSDMAEVLTSFDRERYVFVGKDEEGWCVFEANLRDGMYDELNDLWAESDAEPKMHDLLAPLEITKSRRLESPTEEELEALSGMTGKDLAERYELTDGSLVVNGHETLCNASDGRFTYLVTFDGVTGDDGAADAATEVASLKVKSVVIQGVSQGVLDDLGEDD